MMLGVRYVTFDWRWICGYWDREGGFVRLGRTGAGLVLTCSRPLFSERNGYERRIRLWGSWRVLLVPRGR